MNTYTTITAAREAAPENAVSIIEIEHTDNGRCYIVAACSMQRLASAICSRPMPEIIKLVAEHEVRDDAQISADNAAAQELADANRQCERCGCHVTADAYSQQERGYIGSSPVAVTAYYCDDCRQLLRQVGAGEYTAMQDRASVRGDNTPAHK